MSEDPINKDNGYSIHALSLGPMDNFIYLIRDEATDAAAVVDPAWDVPKILESAGQQGMKITDVLLTHSHHDHINGLDELLRDCDAQLHLLKPESEFWGRDLPRPALHHGGDRIRLGKTEIEILHTPGHTPGSACYRLSGGLGDDLIAGDTLFVYGCGRCDLPGGDPETMYGTLTRLKRELPGGTVVHPGHDYGVQTTSTMQEQTDGNPFLHFDDSDRFVDYRMREHDRTRSTPYAPVKQ